MGMKKLILLLLCMTTVFADDITPQVVEQQIEDAEAEFREAKKMFNPWYTGPLLAPPASVLPRAIQRTAVSLHDQ